MSESREPRRRGGSVVVIVLVLAVIGALIGASSVAVRGTTYTSESQLSWDPSVRAQLDPDYNTPDSTTFDRQVADQRSVILSDDVVDQVAAKLDETPKQVRDSLVVTATAGSSVFAIDASGRSAADARSIATAVTDAYVATLRAENTATLRQRIGALTPVIAALQKQLTGANAVVAGPLAINIAGLQSQSAAYTAALADVPVEATVLREAVAPTGPSSLSVLVAAVLGAALGIVIAICIVLLLNSLPSRQRLPLLPERWASGRVARSQRSAPVTSPAVAASPVEATPVDQEPVAAAPAEERPAEERAADEPSADDERPAEEQPAHDTKPAKQQDPQLTTASAPYFQ